MLEYKLKYYAGLAIDFLIILFFKKTMISFFYKSVSEYYDYYGIRTFHPSFGESFFFQFAFTSILSVGVLTFCYFLFDGKTIGTRIFSIGMRSSNEKSLSLSDSAQLSIINTLHIMSMGLSLIPSFLMSMSLEEKLSGLKLSSGDDIYKNLVRSNLGHQNVFFPDCPIIEEAKIPAQQVEERDQYAA